MSKPLKKGLFGYRKSNVNKYIQEMNESANRMLVEKDAEIKALKAECEAMRAQKDSIAETLLLAKERANEIVASGEQEAELTREKLRADYSRELERIEQVRGWIIEIKKSTAETLAHFEESLKADETLALQKRRAAAPLEDGLLKDDEFNILTKNVKQTAPEPPAPAADKPETIRKPTIIKLK